MIFYIVKGVKKNENSTRKFQKCPRHFDLYKVNINNNVQEHIKLFQNIIILIHQKTLIHHHHKIPHLKFINSSYTINSKDYIFVLENNLF